MQVMCMVPARCQFRECKWFRWFSFAASVFSCARTEQQSEIWATLDTLDAHMARVRASVQKQQSHGTRDLNESFGFEQTNSVLSKFRQDISLALIVGSVSLIKALENRKFEVCG